MASEHADATIQKTQWTGSLLEDLCAALKGERDDATVRAFAKELMTDKALPIEYLVRKVEESIGPAQAGRLDVLVRGRHAVEKSKAENARSQGGVRGLLKRLIG